MTCHVGVSVLAPHLQKAHIMMFQCRVLKASDSEMGIGTSCFWVKQCSPFQIAVSRVHVGTACSRWCHAIAREPGGGAEAAKGERNNGWGMLLFKSDLNFCTISKKYVYYGSTTSFLLVSVLLTELVVGSMCRKVAGLSEMRL